MISDLGVMDRTLGVGMVPWREIRGGRVGLLGEVAAEELGLLCDLGELPPRETVGVILAGDLFVAAGLDKRGGKGDVRCVWELCRRTFRWVSGVAGNHDRFGDEGNGGGKWHSSQGTDYLDGEIVEVDGLGMGGAAGSAGGSRVAGTRFADAGGLRPQPLGGA